MRSSGFLLRLRGGRLNRISKVLSKNMPILTAGFGETKSAWIATLGVNPNFMGQGIGTSMARKIFEIYKAAGIENVYTTVTWDSTDMLSFFKTLGFDRSKFINLRKVID
jgi:N-acetylglutamate synthase-like GNAT family acetyltransferase